MPEVAGDAALTADPTDYKDIAEQMGLLYRDEYLREKLIAAAPAQVARYSWDKAAAVLWDSLLQCASASKGKKRR
jgi:glycosyltransferase involved in cell wall biosynthesis